MISITDCLAEHLFELATGSQLAALYYGLEDNTVVLTHAQVAL